MDTIRLYEDDFSINVSSGEILVDTEKLIEKVQELCEPYETMIVEEDNVKDAKKLVAEIRRVKTSINDAKKKIKNQYMKTYNDFEADIKKAMSLIDETVKPITEDIEKFEEEKKFQKAEMLIKFFRSLDNPYNFSPDLCTTKEMSNLSASVKKSKEEIESKLLKLTVSARELEQTSGKYFDEAMAIMHETGDYFKATQKVRKLEEQEQRVAERIHAEEKQEMQKKSAFSRTVKYIVEIPNEAISNFVSYLDRNGVKYELYGESVS